MKKELNDIKRVVIKIGTSTLTKENAKMDVDRIKKIIKQIAYLRKNGYEVIFVSSGAVGSGNGKLGIKKNTSVAQKQASAAVGQVQLMKLYEELLEKEDLLMGQILLTKDDVTNRKRNLNTKNTINELLKMGIIPVINENDSTVVDEIKVGDNDNLSALVAIMMDASLLVLLSDIDGIYTDNPAKNKDAEFLDVIEKVDKKVFSYAKDKGSEFAVGGMLTKLESAKKVTTAGINMIIANGSRDNILVDIVNNDYKGSLFLARNSKLVAKKKWLLLSSSQKGEVIINNCAVVALKKGVNSLLPVGVVKVNKTFDFGDTVAVIDEKNNLIAYGITNYSSEDIEKNKGKKSSEINDLYETVIHIDNMVLVEEED
ncbi:glutamate 5-kinase [Bacilli bacterium PM5-3]|nr:glutamate 5-kinase [Bacilli bacterium PM5-3]MDH6604310.1 glutamate 5-kinase [Bacilli bacterium PM5-9]